MTVIKNLLSMGFIAFTVGMLVLNNALYEFNRPILEAKGITLTYNASIESTFNYTSSYFSLFSNHIFVTYP